MGRIKNRFPLSALYFSREPWRREERAEREIRKFDSNHLLALIYNHSTGGSGGRHPQEPARSQADLHREKGRGCELGFAHYWEPWLINLQISLNSFWLIVCPKLGSWSGTWYHSVYLTIASRWRGSQNILHRPLRPFRKILRPAKDRPQSHPTRRVARFSKQRVT